MCGIAGAFTREDATGAVRRMTLAMRCRGPDDAGQEQLVDMGGATCGALGHRRLSILDLSAAGHQPMATLDGRYSVVFNGEIYNFRALRDELAREGAQLRGSGDTEVLLAGWARHGRRFLSRLRGMFAFALWDREQRRGVLVRDAFGIKPLYVAAVPGGVAFASEIRGLLASGLLSGQIAPEAVARYLADGSLPEPMTIMAGIRALPAGSVAEVRLTDRTVSLGDATPFASPVPEPAMGLESDPRRAAALVLGALRDSVRHHLVSDVPVGMFLSGGIDSSALVAVASELVSEPLQTFTVTFEERAFSEATVAAAVARRFRTRHHEIQLTGDGMLAALPHAFTSMDQPSMDGLNTYVVSRAVAARGLKVVLSGLGGDEVFGGYASFARAARLQSIWGWSASLRRALATARWPRGVRGEKLRLMASAATPALASYRGSRALFGPAQVRRLAGRAARPHVEAVPAGLSTLQQMSWYELTGYMRNTLLRDSDVFSMAHSLELRVPFVDRDVVRASFSVDDSLKLRRGRSKPLLVAAVRHLLPNEVWDRPKQGFTLPFELWMRGPLCASIDRALGREAVERVGLQYAAVRDVWRRFRAGDRDMGWARPWALFTLVRWAEERGLGVGGTTPEHSAASELAPAH